MYYLEYLINNSPSGLFLVCLTIDGNMVINLQVSRNRNAVRHYADAVAALNDLSILKPLGFYFQVTCSA